MGGAAKTVGNFVSDATGSDTLGKLAGAMIDPLSGPATVTGILFQQVGKTLSTLGLDSLGKEVNRWGSHNSQIGAVLRGEYHDDMKEVNKYKNRVDEYGNRLNARVTQYNLGLQELYDRLEQLVAFDEIFHMAYGNRIDEFQAVNGPELEIMTKEYELMMRELNRLIAELKNSYDFVIGLTEGAFLQKLVGSIIMIVGGLESDLRGFTTGEFDGEAFKRILIAVLAVISIIVSVFTYGLTSPVTVALMVLLFLNLDATYANGAATGAVMSCLDFIFNDLLNLDSLIGSDFEKFDKDHEDYQEMVGYIKLAITVFAVYSAWTSGAGGTTDVNTTSSNGAQAAKESTSYLNGAVEIGDSLSTSSILGVKFSTYSQIYDAYKMYKSVDDVIGMNEQYKEMENKLKSDYEKLNDAIVVKLNKSMMKHYKDSAYFLQDQQQYIDRYLWSMTSQNMYVDPYGTTPVANMRFTPDKDTRGLSFGFEDLFNEDNLAGSKGYFDSIIYGGK